MVTVGWYLLGAGVSLLLWVGWSLWVSAEKAPASTPSVPCFYAPDHKMVLEVAGRWLICLNCDHWEDIPRGAPQEPHELHRWARLHRLLPHQGGRSVSFLEALRGV